MSSEDPALRLEHLRHRTLRELEYQRRHGRLTDDEYTRRTGIARRAASTVDLRPLIADLAAPVPARPAAPAYGPSHQAARPASGHERAVAPASPARPETTRVHRVREDGQTGLVLGLLGGAVRNGEWRPAPIVDALSVMGGIKLDFREAILGPGTTRVRAYAIMAGVAIIVPPGVKVVVKGVALMGAFGPTPRTDAPPGAPCLHVDGLALMGGVDVRVRERDAPDDAPDEAHEDGR